MFVQSNLRATEMIDDAVSLALLVSEDGKRFQQVATNGPVSYDEGSCIVGVVLPDVAKWVEAAVLTPAIQNRWAVALDVRGTSETTEAPQGSSVSV